jgi:RHS repeat-associated protein
MRFCRLFVEPLEDRILLNHTWSGDVYDGVDGSAGPLWKNLANDPLGVQEIVGNVHVPAGKTLTIQQGTHIKFDPGTNLTVDGTLTAPDTAGAAIIFTSIRDNSPEGGANNAGNGDWSTIQFNAGSTGTFDNVNVRYGGGGVDGSVLVKGGASVTFNNGSVSNSSSAGMRILGSSPTVSGDTFQNDSGAAVSMDLASHPSIPTVTVSGNGFNGAVLDGGTLSGNQAWDNAALPYRLNGTVTVAAGATLTVGAGQVVMGRTFSSDAIIVNGTLKAQGTAAAPIVFTSARDVTGNTPANGDWSGLQFTGTSTANVLDHVEVRYAGNGGSGGKGAVYDKGAPLSFTNGVIRNAGGDGLRIEAASPTVSGDTFSNNSGGAISLDLASHPSIPTVTLTNNGTNGAAVDGGTLSGSQFWDNAAVVYRLSGTVTVAAGATLTIGAGQVVKGRQFSSDALIVGGTLTAQGTAAAPIVFTTDRDDYNGNTNNHSGNTPANSDWSGLQFTSTSTANALDHVEVRYAGNLGSGGKGAVYDKGAPLSFTNGVIRNSGGDGLRIEGASPTVSGDTFKDNSGAAVSLDLASHPSIPTVTLTNNGTNGAAVDGGTLSGSQFWDNAAIVYRLSGTVTVAAGATLTIGAGQVVKGRQFNSDAVIVNGSLTAQGTAAAPIVFTTDRDDYNGITNNHAGNTPANGDWSGLQFTSTSTANVLDHVEVRYAGNGGSLGKGAVYDKGAPLSFTNGVIRNSGGDGLRIEGANPTASGDTFKDNSGAAVSLDLASHPSIPTVTLTNNGTNGAILDSGTLSGSQFWDNAAIVYRLSGAVTVAAGATLTIGAGQVVKGRQFNSDALIVGGTLTAQGTAAAPIVFTTDRDDYNGITNNHTGNTPANSDWSGLQFTATSTGNVLDHVEVRYAGNLGSGGRGAVYDKGAPLSFTNGVIRNSGGDGLRIEGASPTVAGDTFKDNSGAAVSMDVASQPSIPTVTLSNNGVNGVALDGGTLSGSPTWANAAIPYRLSGTVTVAAGATLTIGAGQVVKGRQFSSDALIVNGTLKAGGTASAPIVFTTDRDDYNGNTNNQANNTPANNDWSGLQFTSTSTGNVLSYVEVRYAGNGGSGGKGAVYDNGAPLSFTNGVIRNSGNAGLRIEGASPTVSGDAFLNNSGPAVSIDLASQPSVSGVSVSGNGVNGIQVDGGTLAADLSLLGQNLPYSLAGDLTIPAGRTLTIASGTLVRGQDGPNFLGGGTINNAGTILKASGTGTLSVAPQVVNTGTVRVLSGTLDLTGAVTDNGLGILTGNSGATIAVTGNLGGNTQDAGQFTPQAGVTLNGSGTASAPQTLEVMSLDLGDVAAGFSGNFTFYELALANNTYVRLVDTVHNTGGTAAEALYVDNLVVPSGTTLDLNGLHVYARTTQINGTIVGGTIAAVADGGAVALDVPTPGTISPAGDFDDWTFFGRAGQAVTVTVGTGGAGALPPLQPYLNYAQVTLLDPSGNVLATANSTTTGADVTLAGVRLPADGTYHIKVQAPSAQANSTGNYVLTAYDASPRVFPANLNQVETGALDTPYRIDKWTFTAAAGQLVKSDLINAANAGIQFDLTGPNGFTGFSGLTGNSGVITLPTAGTYTLTVHGGPNQTGAYAFRLEDQTITDLTLGTPYDGTISGNAQAQLFRLNVPQAGQLQITLTDPASADRNELYVSLGTVPTRGTFQSHHIGLSENNQRQSIPAAAPGTYYILIYTTYAPNPGPFTLTATEASVYLTGATPDHAGTAADATLTLTGLGFDSTATVSLVSSGNTVYPASKVSLDLPTQLTATFAAGTVPAGVYSVKVTEGGNSATLANAFTVVAGGQAVFNTKLVVPSSLGYHIASVIHIQYSNTGDVAMPAPLLVLTPTQTHSNGTTTTGAFLTLDPSLVTQGFWTSAVPNGFSHTIALLASGATPGVLQPGETVDIPVHYAGWQQPWDFSYPSFNCTLKETGADDPTPVDWNTLAQNIPSPGVEPVAWQAIFTNMQAQMGSTWGAFITALDQDAAYLGSLGENVTDIGQLLAFETLRADGLTTEPRLATRVDAQADTPGLPLTFSRSYADTISGRYQLGPLGRGWTWDEGWASTLAVQSDGTVVITGPGGIERRFQPDSRGGYFAAPGDEGILTAGAGGTFTLREDNGLVTAFRADGKLDYEADPNGNRITAGYTNGLLTSLTASSGQVLQFAYNAAGRIIKITDAVGRVTQFSYDAGNEHLLSVTDFTGEVTTYTYSLGNGAATDHALTSVANPDGTHEFYDYDSRGRLSDEHLDNNAEKIQYTYGPGLAIATTDAGTGVPGGTTTTYLDNRGLVVKVDDPLHHDTFYTYDSNFNLTSMTDAAGQRYVYGYDADGNRTSATDPLGNTTHYVYAGPLEQLSSLTDAKGNTTRYGYDAKGNLTSITNAAGTVEQFAYDPVGNVMSTTDGRGQVTQYTYDSSGRLLTKTFSDGSKVTYGYNAHGNLTTATDANGTVTLTYDGNDRLTQIAYPGGLVLNYQYDAAGRRTQMSDQTGFTVKYTDDAAGRLAGLTDGSGNPIVTYTYYPNGLLQRKDNGNHTYTTYQYDAAGQLLHLINFAPDNSVSSRFDYTYDALGRAATMTTLDGQWVYTYDAIGELTHAVFTSNNPAVVPNQDLQYSYDAAGNRTSAVVNGVTTLYVTNNLNQYTSVGSATYSYDADGNLIQVTDGGVTTTYAYDSENLLTGVSAPGHTTTYQYDPFGDRVAATDNGQTTRYLVEPGILGDVVGQFEGAGNLVAHYTQGIGLTSRVDAANVAAYFNFDATGNTVALTGPTGGVLNRYAYTPFGTLLVRGETVANPFQAVGQFGVMAENNGLEFMRARYYQPTLGRFLQQDPLNVAGDVNLYRYVGNNPITRVDPSGLAGSPTYIQGLVKTILDHITTHGVDIFRNQNISDLFVIVIKKLEQLALKGNTKALQFLEKFAFQIAKTCPYCNPGTIGQIEVGVFEEALVFLFGVSAGAALAAGAGLAVEGYFAYQEFMSVYEWTQEKLQGYKWKETWDQFLLGENDEDDDSSADPSAHDPNDKIGLAGFGTAGFVSPGHVFPYRIDFENDPTATAPAQRVTVTDQLSTNFDWNTFSLTEVGFGDTLIPIPAGTQHFQTAVDVTENGKSFQVQIELGIHPDTGVVYATFQSIDPQTNLPPDVLTGFLPPEDGTGRGMGHFSYTVQPKANLATGTQITNVAVIKFDANPDIATDQVDPHDPSKGTYPAKMALVTIDNGPPTSRANPLPAVSSSASFGVSWSGSGAPGGSGIRSFDVFVSDNGGAFVPFLTGTTQTSATFTGQNGHAYAFYSVATDNVGNREVTPTTAQASTLVQEPTSPLPPSPLPPAPPSPPPVQPPGHHHKHRHPKKRPHKKPHQKPHGQHR